MGADARIKRLLRSTATHSASGWMQTGGCSQAHHPWRYAPGPNADAQRTLSMNPTRHRQLTCRIVGVLLLALLLAQWSVWGHAMAHGTALSSGSTSPEAKAGNERELTWGHEAGAPECRLLDQLLNGQALGAEAAPMPSLPVASTPLAGNDLSPCRQPTLRTYLARGPPQARTFT